MKSTHFWIALVVVLGGIASGAQTSTKPPTQVPASQRAPPDCKGTTASSPTTGMKKRATFCSNSRRRHFKESSFTSPGWAAGSVHRNLRRPEFLRDRGRVPFPESWDARAGHSGKHRLPRCRWCAGVAAFGGIQFPASVLASLPIEAERDGTVLVDADALVLRDAFDLLSIAPSDPRRGGVMVREQSSKAADWRLDKDRSVIDLEHTAAFPSIPKWKLC